MNRYKGASVLTLLVAVLVFAILKTLPSKPVETESGGFSIVENETFPIASIQDPQCQMNDPNLFLIRPKLFQNVSGASVEIMGQATGAPGNEVTVELVNNATEKVLFTASVSVENVYPCGFWQDLGVGNFDPGDYTVRSSFGSTGDGSVLKEVEVPIKLE